MSKKIIAAIIAVLFCLCLALAACGKNPDGSAEGSGPDTEQSGDNITDGPDTEQGDDDITDGIDTDTEESEEITEMYITVGNYKLKVTLAKNSTVDALVEILKKGNITYTAHANNFEIYGDIGHDLTTKNDERLTSQVGDVFLWAGDNICIFFGNNSYSYTRIGRIEGYTADKLKEMLAPSSTVQVTLSIQ